MLSGVRVSVGWRFIYIVVAMLLLLLLWRKVSSYEPVRYYAQVGTCSINYSGMAITK